MEPMRGLSRRSTQPSTRILERAAPAQDSFARLDKIVRGLLGSGQGPTITFVYENNETREWARELHHRIANLAGSEGVRASWWKIDDLSAPGILAGAVSSAVRADIIVIASRGEGLPLPFYVWVNLWWPHRPEVPGTLVALIGRSEPKAPRAGPVGDYLRVVAQQTRMVFFKAEKGNNHVAQREPVAATNGCNGSSGKERSNRFG